MLALLLSLPVPAPPAASDEPRLSTPSVTWETPLLSPSGDRLAIGPWLLDLERKRVVAHLPGFGGGDEARFSADGQRCLMWSRHGGLVLLDARTGEELAARPATGSRPVWTRASAGLERIVQHTTEDTTVLDGSTLKVIADWPGRADRRVALSEDGSSILLAPNEGLWLWTGEGQPRQLALPADRGYASLRFLDGGSGLLIRAREPAGDRDTHLMRIDVATGRVEADVVIPHRSRSGRLDEELGLLVLQGGPFDPDAGCVQVRRLADLELLREYPDEIHGFLIEGTGRLLLGTRDTLMRAVDPLEGAELWRRGLAPAAGKPGAEPRPSTRDADVLLPWFDPSGRLLGTDVLTGGDVELWSMPLEPVGLGRGPSGDLWCGYTAGRLERLDPRTLSVRASADLGQALEGVVLVGSRLVCTTASREAVVVELEDLEVVGRAPCGRGLAASGRGGRVLLYGAEGEPAHLWTPDTGELEELAVRVGRGAAVSEDGSAVVLLAEGGAALVRGDEVRSIELPAGHDATCPVVDADGRWAFIGCGFETGAAKDTTLRAVLLEGPGLARRRVLTLDGAFFFGGEFRRAALSADGTRLACTTGDWVVSIIWDTATWEQLWVEESDGGNASSTETVLSMDGKSLGQWGNIGRARFMEGSRLLHAFEDWGAWALVPGGAGAPPAWLSGSRLCLGVPGERERVERILWPDSEVVLRVDASGERLTGGMREGMVRVREQ